MTTVESLPPFRELVAECGFPAAYKRWLVANRADEKVLVPAWDRREFAAIQAEIGARRRRASFPFGGLPENRSLYVTPTGGRIIPQHSVDPGLGYLYPLDPPDDELLLLTWKLRYWESKSATESRAFAELKRELKERVARGTRDEDRLRRLRGLEASAKRSRARAAEIAEEREPLLPRGLRKPTAEDLAIDAAIESGRSRFDRELDALEL